MSQQGEFDIRPRCTSCHQLIEFVTTPADKQMPVNTVRLTLVTDAGVVVTGRSPHWSTCPHADAHRKPKAKE
jgi:hypothetical protein